MHSHNFVSVSKIMHPARRRAAQLLPYVHEDRRAIPRVFHGRPAALPLVLKLLLSH